MCIHPEDPDFYNMPYQLANGYLVPYYTAEHLLEALGRNQLFPENSKK